LNKVEFDLILKKAVVTICCFCLSAHPKMRASVLKEKPAQKENYGVYPTRQNVQDNDSHPHLFIPEKWWQDLEYDAWNARVIADNHRSKIRQVTHNASSVCA